LTTGASETRMNILGPVFIAALAAGFIVHLQGPASPVAVVQPAAAGLSAPFGVDASCGRAPNAHRQVREILPSPFCR